MSNLSINSNDLRFLLSACLLHTWGSAHFILQCSLTLLDIRFPLLDVQCSGSMFLLGLPELLVALILSSVTIGYGDLQLKHVNQSIDHLQLPPS